MMKKNKPSLQFRLLMSIALLIVAAVLLYFSVDSGDVIRNSDTVSVTENQTETTTISAEFPLNLNTATEEELMQIDGIGGNLAYQIVAYKSEIGGYTSVAQIKHIRGVSDGLYERIKDQLTV